MIDSQEILKARQEALAVPINGCMSFHMICYKPDGTILCKKNICSCESCILGRFMECSIERGVHVSGETATEDDFCDSDD